MGERKNIHQNITMSGADFADFQGLDYFFQRLNNNSHVIRRSPTRVTKKNEIRFIYVSCVYSILCELLLIINGLFYQLKVRFIEFVCTFSESQSADNKIELTFVTISITVSIENIKYSLILHHDSGFIKSRNIQRRTRSW